MSCFGRTATISVAVLFDYKSISHFCLLCHFQRIIDFDTKVAQCTFKLGVTKK